MIDPETGELVDSTEYLADIIQNFKQELEERQQSLKVMTELFDAAQEATKKETVSEEL